METRYCGQVTIELEYLGREEERLRFGGKIIVGNGRWEFDHVLVEKSEPSAEAFDIAASGAVHYASKYNRAYDPAQEGEVPGWAPPADFAQEINDNLSFDDLGYCIRREADGPVTYSG